MVATQQEQPVTLRNLLTGGYTFKPCIEIRQGSASTKTCYIANKCTEEWIVKYSYKRLSSGLDLVTGLKMKVGEEINQDECLFIDWAVVQIPGSTFYG